MGTVNSLCLVVINQLSFQLFRALESRESIVFVVPPPLSHPSSAVFLFRFRQPFQSSRGRWFETEVVVDGTTQGTTDGDRRNHPTVVMQNTAATKAPSQSNSCSRAWRGILFRRGRVLEYLEIPLREGDNLRL
jgi:hypothetical protein